MERNIRLDWQSLVKEAIVRRKSLHFTQEKLALIAGVSKPTVVRFEKGCTTIKLQSALKILEQLGLA